ncbi:hypothetical protein PR202_ga05834 [Eleusine coracana subsp. coracana]|uniref:CRAL-TRIO domain-containing protein n=1 Tax=Eleusine coracana subsp. coracana TaxID=191504 RepID=A0AAV5BT93_ELECO|nr:hypothetical protein PR202_ga05834 [Eleusine coracana subsp. coracana]
MVAISATTKDGQTGFEGFIHNDERKESKSDADNSEGDKKTKIGSFKKKAINAGNKFRHSLRRRSKKRENRPVSIEDIRDVKELRDVETFRQCLVDEDLLPQQHDDYHMMLRFLKARKFDVEKAKNMWSDMLRWRKEFGTDKIETLCRMYIINAGQGFKMLWNTIKSFLDPKTASKIHVLGNKYQHKLLEIIDECELPEFFGGKCKCDEYGGCQRSDKGPWKDPNTIKRVLNGEANYGRQIVTISSTDGKIIGYARPISNQSGSEMEDATSPAVSRNLIINPNLTPVHEEASV